MNIERIKKYPKTAEKYPNWDGEPFLNDRIIDVVVVGMSYHISEYEYDDLNIGDLLFLKREPTNPVDKEAIAVFKGNKLIGYVGSEDIPLLEITIPETYALPCYIQKKLDKIIVVDIPAKDMQETEYLTYCLSHVPSDIDFSRCPILSFEITCDPTDAELKEEFKQLSKEYKNNENLYYYMLPNGEEEQVAFTRHFGNGFHFETDNDLISDYMTESPNGCILRVESINKRTYTINFEGTLYKEY